MNVRPERIVRLASIREQAKNTSLVRHCLAFCKGNYGKYTKPCDVQN